ncbi:MAG: M28 family peptidase [Bacteroidetes bacterium]|nr:MAG: M28 family peptidase [Bacteroidota bacterium]
MKTTILLLFASILTFLFSCSREQPKSGVQQPTSSQSHQQEQPSSSTQPVVNIPIFDAQRAFDLLVTQTNFGPRYVGSRGHSLCLVFLQNELKKYTDTVWSQNFSKKGYDNEILAMTNVIGSFMPKSKSRILLLAHWDTRPRADQDKDPAKRNQPILGANDAASGVAVLLEIARCLKNSPPTIGVDILFVDGEDYGKEGDNPNYLLGSRHFVSNLPKDYSPKFGILLDMIGDSQLEIKKERQSLRFAPDIVELVWSTAFSLGIQQFTNAIENNLGADDHIPLNQAGIKTIDLIDFNYPNATVNYWHTTEDTPDKCSAESLDAVGRVLLQVIYTQN